MKRRGPRWALLLALVALGCMEPQASGTESVATWALGEPVLTLGSLDDGPQAFSRIESVAVGPRSELHVLLPQQRTVRVFDASGAYLLSIGREGAGPGELRGPRGIGFVGDTLWVRDPSARRVTYFFEGELVRTENFPQSGEIHPDRSARVDAVVAGPGFLVATDGAGPFAPLSTPVPGLLFRAHTRGLDTLGSISVDNVDAYYMRASATGGVEFIRRVSQPFSDIGLWGVSPDGSSIAVVDRRSGADSAPPHYTVSVLSAAGDTLAHARLDYEPVPIDPEHVDSILADWESDGLTAREARDLLFLPPAYPPVTRVLVARDGTLWLATDAVRAPYRVWRVLSPQGTPLAAMEVPPDFEPMWVEPNAVWGLVLDELDVPYLVKRPVVRD